MLIQNSTKVDASQHLRYFIASEGFIYVFAQIQSAYLLLSNFTLGASDESDKCPSSCTVDKLDSLLKQKDSKSKLESGVLLERGLP